MYSLRLLTNVKLYLLVSILVYCPAAKVAYSASFNESSAHKDTVAESIQLTLDEKKWLVAHKTIRIGYDGSLPPYSFINDQGRIDGIAVEIMAILSQRIGAEFVIHPDSNWGSLYRDAAAKKVDIIAAMVARSDRVKWFNFTKPYLTKSLVIVTRKDNTAINSRGDLANKRVAVVKGYRYVDQIGAEFPTATAIKLDSMLDSLKKVESGYVDAAILFLGTANFLQAKHQLKHLKVAAFFERNSADESIAVRKDWPILVEILQKGLDSLTDQEVEKIFSKWVVQGGVAAKESNETATKGTDKAAANATSTTATKKLVEVDQKPGVFNNAPKTTDKPPQEVLDISKMLVFFMVILTSFLLWFMLSREMKKQRQKARNEMMVSVRNLQSDTNEDMHLTIAPVSVDRGSSDEPISGLGDGQDSSRSVSTAATLEPAVSPPITLDAQKLAQKKPLEILSNEQIQYQRDENGGFSFISHTIAYVLGYSEADFMANYRDYLTDNPINQKFHDYVEMVIQGQPAQVCEIEIFDAVGDIHWLLVSGSAIYDGQGHCIGVQGTMNDITNEKVFGKLTAKEAETDQVIKTNLPQSFHESLQEAIRWADKGGNPFSVIFLSLERLRYLDGGSVDFPPDVVLKEASKRLRATLRDSDTVIEMDVDKFALILPETNEQTANLIGEKIRKILQVPYLIGVQSIVLDTALGFAAYPSHGSSPEALIKQAQMTATINPVEPPPRGKKKAGADLSDDASLQLQQDLVYALDECKVALRASGQKNVNALNRHSQFLIHYQSRHSLSDYSISGFEALIRWQHPELGMLLPRDFIGLVKGIGLLDVMTYWLIQQVSFQAQDWEEKGIRPNLLSVNLGDLTNKQAVDVKKIAAIVNETGAKPEWLMFSIMEGDFANQADSIAPIVEQLVATGFTVGIDNFSSESMVNTLKSLPVDIVEMDPAFARYVPGNSDNKDTVTRCIGALHALGKTVLAKEIETQSQLDFLKTCGCDVIQGHLLSRPLPAKEAKELIENLPDFAWYLKQ